MTQSGQCASRNLPRRSTSTTTPSGMRCPTPGVIPLLAAVAYATGDLSVLRDELRPDPTRLLEPDGGVDGDRLALARQLAFDALARFRDGGSVAAPRPGRRRHAPDPRLRGGGRHGRGLPPAVPRGALGARRRHAGARLEPRRAGAGHALPGGGHRRRHVRHRGGLPAQAGGRAVRDPREGSRSRRHLVGEHLSGVPGRRGQPLLQLLVRPTGGLAAALLHAGGAARVLPDVHRALRAAGAHPLRDRGDVGRVERRERLVDPVPAHVGRARRRSRRRPSSAPSAS